MSKTYIDGSSAKAITWQFWEFFNISFNLEKLQQYANEKGYVNIVMSPRKEIWQYWDTHYFTLNEWKPEWDKKETKKSDPYKKAKEDHTEISVEDIPF